MLYVTVNVREARPLLYNSHLPLLRSEELKSHTGFIHVLHVIANGREANLCPTIVIFRYFVARS